MHQDLQKLIFELNDQTGDSSEFHAFARSVPDFAPQYIECRLNGDPQVDYLYCVDTQESLDHYPLNVSTQDGIVRLLRICDRIPYIWLEYDDVKRGAFDRDPCWHACVNANYLKHYRQDPISYSQVVNVVEFLADQELAQTSLSQAVRSLCDRDALVHVSCMRERNPKSIKLFVKVSAKDLRALLADIGWPGDMTMVESMATLSWIRPMKHDTISLDLKWEGNLLPYIGVVNSRIDLSKSAPGALQIASLIDRDVLHQDAQIHAVMHWLNHLPDTYTRWVDLKTYNEGGGMQTKIYFGIQNTGRAFARQLFPDH